MFKTWKIAKTNQERWALAAPYGLDGVTALAKGVPYLLAYRAGVEPFWLLLTCVVVYGLRKLSHSTARAAGEMIGKRMQAEHMAEVERKIKSRLDQQANTRSNAFDLPRAEKKAGGIN
jgi:hypothetical protein